MRSQQVTKVSETVVQEVKKTCYASPIRKIGVVEGIGVGLQNLTCDVLQKSPGTKFLKCSLNEFCAAHYIDGVEMTKLFEKFPNLDPHLGMLPSSLFKSVESVNIIKTRKEISQILDKYALKIGSVGVGREDALTLGKSLQKELSETLNQNLTVELLGNGAWSRCYKLSINDKNYALKFFNDSNYGNPIMGPSAEPGVAYLLNNISDKTAKFYFGKIGVENNQGAYTISEFLQGSIPSEFRKEYNTADLRKYFWSTNLSNNPSIKITPLDFTHGNLPIGGKFFDFGMFNVEILNNSEKDFIFHVT